MCAVVNLEKVVKETAGKNVLDFHFSSVQRIEKKEELANSRTDIKGIEWLLQTIQLQKGNMSKKKPTFNNNIMQLQFTQLTH